MRARGGKEKITCRRDKLGEIMKEKEIDCKTWRDILLKS